MTRQDVARLLDPEGPFEERLNEVAPSAKDDNHKAEADVLYRGKRKEEGGRRHD